MITIFPTKKQWSKWTLPSKATVLAFYISLGTIVFSIISYFSYKGIDYLSSLIKVKEVSVSSALIDTLTGGNYLYNNGSMNIRCPQIRHILPNHFFSEINAEILACALSCLKPDIIDYEFDYVVGLETSTILSIKIDQYYYYEKTPHGSASIIAINIDPSEEKSIDFFDIFDARRNALAEIKNKIRKGIKSKNCEYFSEFLNNPSFIPRFFIKTDSIEFIFSQYEVSPGYCGSFTVDIPLKEVLEFLRRDGPLGYILSPTGSWIARDYFLKAIFEDIEIEDTIE